MKILELKNAITKIISSMDRPNGRMKGTRERIGELEYRMTEITYPEQKR